MVRIERDLCILSFYWIKSRKYKKIIRALIRDFIKYPISPRSILLINEHEWNLNLMLQMVLYIINGAKY